MHSREKENSAGGGNILDTYRKTSGQTYHEEGAMLKSIIILVVEKGVSLGVRGGIFFRYLALTDRRLNTSWLIILHRVSSCRRYL